MTIFNGKEFNNTQNFECLKCGFGTKYRIAISGCPICSNSLFKLSDKGVVRLDEPLDDKRDPYHDEAKSDPHSGKGYNKNRLGEEDFFGGGNNRGDLDPRKDDYGTKKDLPSDSLINEDLDDPRPGIIKNPAENYNMTWTFDENSALGNPFVNKDQSHAVGPTNMHSSPKSNEKEFDDIFNRSKKSINVRGVLR